MKKIFTLFLFLLFNITVYSQVIQGNFNFDGLNRTYSVYLPASFQPDESFPLLIALHGLTQNGNTMLSFSGFNAIADTGNFVVVYPNGISNSWNVGLSGGSSADDVGFLVALVDTLHHQFNIDFNKVYATGFSNGGFMSYKLACEVPDTFAAIAPVSGTMTEASLANCQPSVAMPVLHIHGTSDFVVSYTGNFGNVSAEAALEVWTGFNNCPAAPMVEVLPDLVSEGSTVERYTWAPCDDGTEVVLLKVLNGGHTWPGSVGVTGIGITNRDIVASSEIWNFVKRFSKAGSTGIPSINPSAFYIYPNPNAGKQITITSGKPMGNLSVSIIEISGRLVFTKQVQPSSSAFLLNLPDMKPGYYMINLSGIGYTDTQKLVVY
jgi:polyhydroxybutyrate depolymerase